MEGAGRAPGAGREAGVRERIRALGLLLMEEQRKLVEGQEPDLRALERCREALGRIAAGVGEFETALRAGILALKADWIAAQASRAEAARRYGAALDALRKELGPERVHLWLDAEAALADLLAAEAAAQEALGAAERLFTCAFGARFPSAGGAVGGPEGHVGVGSSTGP